VAQSMGGHGFREGEPAARLVERLSVELVLGLSSGGIHEKEIAFARPAPSQFRDKASGRRVERNESLGGELAERDFEQRVAAVVGTDAMKRQHDELADAKAGAPHQEQAELVDAAGRFEATLKRRVDVGRDGTREVLGELRQVTTSNQLRVRCRHRALLDEPFDVRADVLDGVNAGARRKPPLVQPL